MVPVHSTSTDTVPLWSWQPPVLKTWLQCLQTSHRPGKEIKDFSTFSVGVKGDHRSSHLTGKSNQLQRAFIWLNLQPLALLTLSGHHWSSSPKETGLWTGMLFLSKLASPSRLVEPRSVSNEAPSSHRRSRNLNTDSRSRNSSESRSKGRRRTGMQ